MVRVQLYDLYCEDGARDFRTDTRLVIPAAAATRLARIGILHCTHNADWVASSDNINTNFLIQVPGAFIEQGKKVRN